MQNFFKISYKQLMLSNVFLGSRKESFRMIMNPFIFGYRGPFCILNLFYTYIQFKLLVYILINIVLLRKKILVIKEDDLYNFKLNFKSKSLYFYNKKWIGGCLTNFKVVSRHPKFLELSKSFLSLRNLKFLPSFLFLFDPNISEYALFEGYTLGILTSGIANSDCYFFESINYPIIGNTECYESMYLYMHIIKDSIKLGRVKEYRKIAHVRVIRISKYKKELKRLQKIEDYRRLIKLNRLKKLRKLNKKRIARKNRLHEIKERIIVIRRIKARNISKIKQIFKKLKLTKNLIASRRLLRIIILRKLRKLKKSKKLERIKLRILKKIDRLQLLKRIQKLKKLKRVKSPEQLKRLVRIRRLRNVKKLRKLNKLREKDNKKKKKFICYLILEELSIIVK
jgi:ribosomal protein S2